ncbi:hypothetical protein [Paraburkholderia caffeinitolerans]|uniref:hypothetical protein n=1 Tax=Paraburkholderia caffeinitolerans TaxID=1723730 RepID=UPI0015834B3C|nr:hypothetical protein [Paraburkholderia caffeinitolerans]
MPYSSFLFSASESQNFTRLGAFTAASREPAELEALLTEYVPKLTKAADESVDAYAVESFLLNFATISLSTGAGRYPALHLVADAPLWPAGTGGGASIDSRILESLARTAEGRDQAGR